MTFKPTLNVHTQNVILISDYWGLGISYICFPMKYRENNSENNSENTIFIFTVCKKKRKKKKTFYEFPAKVLLKRFKM